MELISTGFLAFALLMGGQIGLPLGLPPLPEDPVLSSIAPEECLAYFSWSGVAEPDSKSKNQTEQLLAEPEVKQFVSTVGKALGAAIKKGAPATPQGQVLGAHGPKLIHALLTHPTALFISKIGFGPHGPQLSGGALVATGDQSDEVKASLAQIEKVLLTAAATGGGVQWHKFPVMPDVPPVEWGFRGKYLIVGVGAGAADQIVSRLEGKPPAWLVAVKEKLPVERVSTVFFLNVNRFLGSVRPLSLEPDARQILEILGLANVKAIASVSGLDGTGCIAKTWVRTDGNPTGLLAVFGPEPLTAADLAPIPKDASFAAAARIHPARLFDTVLEGIKKANPDMAEANASQLKEVEAMLGFRFKEDLLETLGDSWCVYNSPGEGGLLITGLTLVVPLKDRDRLAKTNDRLMDLAQSNSAATGFVIKETTIGSQRIFYTNPFGGEGLPFAPAWCVSDKHLIVAVSPQNVRAVLARGGGGSVADLPVVAERLKSGGPVLLTYQDTAGMLKITYPILQMFATFGFSEMQREGLDLDASVLPSLASIVRHVEPGCATLTRGNDGLVYVSRQSLPVAVELPVLTVATTFLGFTLPMRAAEAPPREIVPDIKPTEPNVKPIEPEPREPSIEGPQPRVREQVDPAVPKK